MVKTILLLMLAAVASLFGDSPDGVLLAGPLLAPIAIGAAGSLINKFVGGGGGPTSTAGPDPATAEYRDYMRQFGQGQAEDLVGRTGEFAAPLTEDFDMSSIDRFLNPFLDKQRGFLQEDYERAGAAGDIRARNEATLSGNPRGARGALLQSEAARNNLREYLRAENELGLQGYGQAGEIALGAQPFRTEHMQEGLLRGREARDALNFGMGPEVPGQEMQGPGSNMVADAFQFGSIASTFGDRNEIPFGPGDPLRPPMNLPGIQPPDVPPLNLPPGLGPRADFGLLSGRY